MFPHDTPHPQERDLSLPLLLFCLVKRALEAMLE
jgi:hypothetical protein